MSLYPCLRDRGTADVFLETERKDYRMFGPEERQRAVDLYSATPMTRWSSTWVIRPGSVWNAGWRRIPGMPAIWRNPSSRWKRGPRRSSWCWTACAEAGRRTVRRGRRRGPQLSQGVSRGRHGRVAAQKQERQPDQQACAATKPKCQGRR